MILLSSIVTLLYAYLILRFLKGWKIGCCNVTNASASSCLADVSVSVVVCCRNEAQRLPFLIEAIAGQCYPDFELVWVDDHSDDNTLELMLDSLKIIQKPGLSRTVRIVHSQYHGKKAALKTGVQAAGGKLILTTDADCFPSTEWVNEMVVVFLKTGADVMIGPVQLNTSSSTLQQLEFCTLVASGMASAAAEHPFMANGANLGFRKASWLDVRDQLNDHEMSGDDVFLIHAVKKKGGKVVGAFSQKAIVKTQAKTSFNDFFKQRFRWASKSPSYRDRDIIFTQSVVVGMNILLLFLLLIVLFTSIGRVTSASVLLAISAGVKFSLDSWFIRRFYSFFSIRVNPFLLVLLFIAYPLYVLAVGFGSLVYRRQW